MAHSAQRMHKRVAGLLDDVVDGATQLVGDTVSVVTQAAGDLFSPNRETQASSSSTSTTPVVSSSPSQTTLEASSATSPSSSSTNDNNNSSATSSRPNSPESTAGSISSVDGEPANSSGNGALSSTILGVPSSGTDSGSNSGSNSGSSLGSVSSPGQTPQAGTPTTHGITTINGNPATTSSSGSASALAMLNVAGASSSGASAEISVSSTQILGPGIAAGTNYTPSSSLTSSASKESGSGSGSNGSANSQATSQGLPVGAIAAIAIVASITLAAIIILVIRRWCQKRRSRRLENWTTGMGGSFGLFGAISDIQIEKQSEKHDSGASRNGDRNGTRSARSSFGTTFDRGLRPFTPDPFSPDSITIPHSQSGDLNESQDRLAVPNQMSLISVHPWSPSERWAFPKPPTVTSSAQASAEDGSTSLGHASTTSLPSLPQSDTVSYPNVIPGPVPSQDEQIRGTRRLSSATINSESAVTSHTGATDTSIGNVATIKRPFVPTLSDELFVARGDIIRVIQTFDDGWVYVAKLNVSNGDPDLGLIPVDCLTEAGEPLPAFLSMPTRSMNAF